MRFRLDLTQSHEFAMQFRQQCYLLLYFCLYRYNFVSWYNICYKNYYIIIMLYLLFYKLTIVDRKRLFSKWTILRSSANVTLGGARLLTMSLVFLFRKIILLESPTILRIENFTLACIPGDIHDSPFFPKRWITRGNSESAPQSPNGV